MAAPIPFLKPRTLTERTVATVKGDCDAFMTGWQVPELRQAHDVQDWVLHPRSIDIREHLDDVKQVLQPGDSLLDVGCYAGYAHDYLCPSHYVGVDILPEAVAAARELHPGVTFEVGDLFDLKQRADIVLCSRVLIHLPRFEEAVAALCRAANKFVVLVLALADEDRCDRLEGEGYAYYFRWFALDTVLKTCGRHGLVLVRRRTPYATVFIKIS